MGKKINAVAGETVHIKFQGSLGSKPITVVVEGNAPSLKNGAIVGMKARAADTRVALVGHKPSASAHMSKDEFDEQYKETLALVKSAKLSYETRSRFIRVLRSLRVIVGRSAPTQEQTETLQKVAVSVAAAASKQRDERKKRQRIWGVKARV